MQSRKYWLAKREPTAYSWPDFAREGGCARTGARNSQALNHLRAMKKGDRVFFCHSVIGKCLVGLAEIVRGAYPDPTAGEGGLVVCGHETRRGPGPSGDA